MDMNPALPPNLINPAFEELEETALTADVSFAKDTSFLFRCWQTYHVQRQFADDMTVPRSGNLFWRVWSNPNLRSISNQEFNQLWQRCGRHTPLAPYRPDPIAWSSYVGRPSINPLPPPAETNPEVQQAPLSPISPRATKITFDQHSLDSPSQARRERGPSGGAGSAAPPPRPAFKRTTSGRTMTSTGSARGGRSRPPLPRRKSSQSRGSVRTAEPAAIQAVKHDEQHASTISKARAKGTFELGSSWQSEDESNEEKPDLPRNFTGSLVEPGFRSKFVEQRQLSIGSSLPTSEAIRKVRSSVRFADEDDSIPADKGKRVERPGLDEGDDREKRGRSNSQVLTDSDGSEGAPELQRVHSQLSMLIKDKRKQSGSQDLGPCSQPESERAAEARRKREELLKQGRQAAAPIIPTSRPGRPSYDDEGGRDRSPSPNATF